MCDLDLVFEVTDIKACTFGLNPCGPFENCIFSNTKQWYKLSYYFHFQAKNVILFIGDGMGPSTVTAARFHKATRDGTEVKDTKLSWETMNNVALSKVRVLISHLLE